MKRRGLKKFGAVFGEGFEFSKGRKNIAGSLELQNATAWEKKQNVDGSKTVKNVASSWRLIPGYLLFIALGVILLSRAFELQVIKGSSFLGEAKGNYVRIEVDHAPRGVIYDRNGVILAQNKPGFRLFIEPSLVPSDKKWKVYSQVSKILKIPEKEIEKKLSETKSSQVTIARDLSNKQAIIVEAGREGLPGVGLEITPKRSYLFGEAAAHILGYTGEANQEEIDRKTVVPYQVGDKVGRAGVEASFEDELRGSNGYTLTSVSAEGEILGEIYHNDPLSGQNITLSIDIELQKYVYRQLKKKLKALGAKSGSAVVLNPKTGEVLALVSQPAFDNNIFSENLSQKQYDQITSNPQKPLLNRAIGAAYPPGSTFKMITSVAGLESGTIQPDTKIKDPGYITLGTQVFNNWLWTDHRKTEGSINVVRALARSTDTFFYELGRRMGEEAIEKYSKMLGLGEKGGVDLPEEAAGLVPNNAWKLETKGEPWYPGETLNMSIGQGDLLVSPIQISRVIAVFANGGKLVVPTIVKTNNPKIEKGDFLKAETIKTVSEGLYQNTVGDGNVGWLFRDFKIKSAGKTGTAEAGDQGPHAWYTGYFPYPKADIVATVMIEHAGHGSEQSAPIVKKIFEWWEKNR